MIFYITNKERAVQTIKNSLNLQMRFREFFVIGAFIYTLLNQIYFLMYPYFLERIHRPAKQSLKKSHLDLL